MSPSHHSATRRSSLSAGSSVGPLAALRTEQADPEVQSLGPDHQLPDQWKEFNVAGKKRMKSLAKTEKKAPAKPKRPKKTSRGK